MPAERKRTERLLKAVRERKERHRERGRAYRISVAAGGALLIVAGLLLSAPGVPGPGLLIVAAGLALLALEFDRAERLLERAILWADRLRRRAERTTPRQRALANATALVVVAAIVAAILLWDVPLLPV